MGHRRNASSSSSAAASLDTASTTSVSKQPVEDEPSFNNDDSHQMSLFVEDPFNYHFLKNLQNIFDDEVHKTVLLSEIQMKEIHKSIAADYTEVLVHVTSEEDLSQGLKLHMRCASHVLQQFWEMPEKILQATMGLTNQEMLFHSVEEYIFPSMMYQLYPTEGELSPDAMAMAISWIYNLEKEMQRLAPDVMFREDWTKERNKLFEHYLEQAVRHKMTILLMEVLKLHSDKDIRRDAEGQLVTGLPEQVSYIFNQQLKIASECLPFEFKDDILMACNEALMGLIHDWIMRISTEWTQMSTNYLCATINDTFRLLEYCDERHENFLTRPEAVEMAADVSRHIAEFSLHATQYLCERIMYDLRVPEPTLDLVGTESWESSEGPSFVACVTETFKDYFADIEGWLIRDYFFPKVLKNCFDLALETYLESFFANTMVRGVTDATTVATELDQDYLRFAVFFNGEQFMAYHGRGGFYTAEEINKRLRILQYMAALIDPTNLPEYLSNEVQQLLHVFGNQENGDPAVWHLIALRGRTRARDSARWLKIIASAEKELAKQDDSEKLDLHCRIPDVRNSKMLRKIRVPARSEIPREISEESRPFAESAVRLLQQPARFVAPSVMTAWRERIPHNKQPAEKAVHDDGPVVDARDAKVEHESDDGLLFEGRILAEF